MPRGQIRCTGTWLFDRLLAGSDLADASLVHLTYEPDRDLYVLTLDHPSFPAYQEGATLPQVRPTYTSYDLAHTSDIAIMWPTRHTSW